MSDQPTRNKALLLPMRQAMSDFPDQDVHDVLQRISASDAVFRLGYPFGNSVGAEAYYQSAFRGLLDAWPDLERRDTIAIAGPDEDGEQWVGCCGTYVGTFLKQWLDIPPTGHIAHMRFHEFYRIRDNLIVEMQALWDIPEVMLQAGAWPMAPSLGRDWHVPAPATQDGLVLGPHDPVSSDATRQLIISMIQTMIRHPKQGGPEVMELERYWHPRMNWYGPSGIGTSRGISGFRNWHQIPFLNAMPDRGVHEGEVKHHFFADGKYAAVTGWPNMGQTLSNSGWLGIAPTGSKVTLRSLDFWRVEDGLIRENWVLVDLLDLYAQLGVDVFARLREFNKARNTGPIQVPDGMS